jgi:hypothetical protein
MIYHIPLQYLARGSIFPLQVTLAVEKLQSQGPSQRYENLQEMPVYSAPKAVTLCLMVSMALN